MSERQRQPGEKLLVILGDGGAKTSKTTVSKAIEQVLRERGLQVSVADAGQFIRRITRLALEALTAKGFEPNDDHTLDQAVDAAVQSEAAFDDERDWGDLEADEIGTWVGIVAKRESVQAQKKVWYKKIVEQTLERKDAVLILNSRSPRDHLAEWLGTAGPLDVRLVLFTECDAEVGARRQLAAAGTADPDAATLAAATAKIEARRKSDLLRPNDPFVPPPSDRVVHFNPALSAEEIIAQTNDLAVVPPAEAPWPIQFDTTHLPKDRMEQAAQQLALVALGLPHEVKPVPA